MDKDTRTINRDKKARQRTRIRVWLRANGFRSAERVITRLMREGGKVGNQIIKAVAKEDK